MGCSQSDKLFSHPPGTPSASNQFPRTSLANEGKKRGSTIHAPYSGRTIHAAQRHDKVPRGARFIFKPLPSQRQSVFVYLFILRRRGRGVTAALSRPVTYQEVVKFNFNSHGQCQSLVEGEARPWHQDVLARVSQHCQGKLYRLAAATC